MACPQGSDRVGTPRSRSAVLATNRGLVASSRAQPAGPSRSGPSTTTTHPSGHVSRTGRPQDARTAWT